MTSNRSADPVVREYARLAANYDRRWPGYIQSSTQHTLARLPLHDCRRMLDVGCGTGTLLATLAREQPQLELSGVDPCREMLEVARKKCPPQVQLQTAEAACLPFPAAAFDLVVSISAFHYFRQPAQAMAEMQRVLSPGGRIVITDWCHDFWTCRACDLYLRVFDAAHRRIYPSRDCRKLLQQAGFAHCKLERYKINWLWGLMTASCHKE